MTCWKGANRPSKLGRRHLPICVSGHSNATKRMTTKGTHRDPAAVARQPPVETRRAGLPAERNVPVARVQKA